MPFSLRKSIKAGPFRFNLSRSGIGISVGIKGLRLGTGPRGHYISSGIGGFQYQQSLRAAGEKDNSPQNDPFTDDVDKHGRVTHAPLEEIESGNVLEMKNATANDLLDEINQKQNDSALWVPAGISFLAAILLTVTIGAPQYFLLPISVVGIVATLSIYIWDKQNKLVVLFYDLDSNSIQAFEKFCLAFDAMSIATRKWHISAQGNVYDRKYHAGAGSLVKRNAIQFSENPPSNIKTNLSIPTIPVGKQLLCFFPDRLFVFDETHVGAVAYSDLHIGVAGSTFVEDGNIPKDARQVGRTWQFVNKNGSPDRRFNNNRELPLMAYEEVRFRSSNGLNECIQLSLVGSSENFGNAVKRLASLTE